MRHIEEARALSARLGGMDRDVKDYFFTLSPSKLSEVLDLYGDRYGQDKREYAEQVYPKWKNGSVNMSGLVAGRLFDLLPTIMPIDLKLRIVEGLFDKSLVSRTDYVLAPASSSPSEIVGFVHEKFFGKLGDQGISDNLKRQFQWLAGEDATVAEKLLNHSLQLSLQMKKEASTAILGQLDLEREKHSDTIRQITSTIRVRDHEVRVKRSSEVAELQVTNQWGFEKDGRPQAQSKEDSGGMFWVIAIGIFVLFVIFSGK